MHFILGSSSPRRKEILNYFSLPFEQFTLDFDEEKFEFTGDPIEYASLIAQDKANAIGFYFPSSLLLTADTVVHCEGKLYSKPQNREQAQQFLMDLSGKWHEVFTAVTLQKGKEKFTEVAMTKILFHSLSAEQIHFYIEALQPFDKAGAYAVQKGGNLIVKRMEGCYYNVMGLPLTVLESLMNHFDISLWHYLKRGD